MELFLQISLFKHISSAWKHKSVIAFARLENVGEPMFRLVSREKNAHSRAWFGWRIDEREFMWCGEMRDNLRFIYADLPKTHENNGHFATTTKTSLPLIPFYTMCISATKY